VDGQTYIQPTTFVWPAGSKHLLVFVADTLLPNQAGGAVQTSANGTVQYVFGGWVDNTGLLLPSSDPIQTITADPRVTSMNAVSVSPPACGSPGVIPEGQLRTGVVFLGSQCFWNTATVFVPANSTLTLNAIPYPGFVFLGWVPNLGEGNSYLTSIKVKSSLTITPLFAPGKRVHFMSTPLGMQVLVDRTITPTRRAPLDLIGLCPSNESLPISPLTGFPPLCLGDFDFAAGSTHVISAVSPQLDATGKVWVFDSFTNGMGANSVYTTDNNVSTPDVLTAKFAPGAHVDFLTNPAGLKLTVDGRSNFAAYDFIWGLGSTHTVSASASQFDSKGRQFTFLKWSNAGTSSQTVNVDQSAVDNGLVLTATYNVLSRIIIQSAPSGLNINVDGATCQTPCTFDRQNGAQLHVTVPTSIPTGDGARLDFASWSDGGASDRALAVNSDYQVVTANYTAAYRLSAASDPANGVTFRFDPASSDMYYAQDTPVNITAKANGGFKFRRWGGDLSGTYPSGFLSMSSAHAVMALLDRIPYIAPAGVRNAAGDTPSSTVAPGSIITIFGESLAPTFETGRVNPLAQTIQGVTVTVNDRILGLLYVSPQQINAQIPSDLPDGDYTLQVHSIGQPDVSATFTVARNSPGLFGQMVNAQPYALALHGDGSPVTLDNPAASGETISLLGTGFGPYSGLVIDGFFPPDPAPALTDAVNVSAAGQSATVVWSGAAPGYTGLTLTKFTLPDGMPGGSTVQVTVNVNGANSNAVMLPVQ